MVQVTVVAGIFVVVDEIVVCGSSLNRNLFPSVRLNSDAIPQHLSKATIAQIKVLPTVNSTLVVSENVICDEVCIDLY